MRIEVKYLVFIYYFQDSFKRLVIVDTTVKHDIEIT